MHKDQDQKGQAWIIVAIIIAVIIIGSAFVITRPSGVEELEVSNLRISPQENISPGDEVSISVDVTNPGDVSMSKTIVLRVGGEPEDSREVRVSPGETKTVEFTVTREEKTIYSVEVARLKGRFAVGMLLPVAEVKNPDILIIDTIGGPESLDPAWAYDTASGEKIFNVYEPLIFFKGEKVDEFEPRLATEWDISPDGLTYRFKIREGVKFHNGNPLTPSDVEYSFERAMVQDRSGGPVWMLLEPLLGIHSTRKGGEIVVSFEDIDKAVEVEDGWVVFHLPEPYPPFIQILSQSWSSIIDKEWAVEQGAWLGTPETWKEYNNPETPPLQDVMNGTGPFKFTRWEKGVQVVLERNEGYWRDPPKLKMVKIKLIEGWATRKLEFLAGDADIVYVPRPHIKELEGIEEIRVYKDLPSMVTSPAVFFTFEIDPKSEWIGSGKLDGEGIPPDFFSDRHVRLAFAHAFDYKTFIRDALLGEGVKVPGPIPTTISYFNPDQETFSFDMEKADEHFRKAFGGTVDEPGPVWENGFTMTLLYNTGNEERKIACEIFEKKVEEINDKFKIDVRNRDWPTYLGELVSSKLTMFIIGWVADYPDPHNFVYPFMHSEGTFTCFQKVSDPEVDNLIEQGIATVDPDERRRIYYELQRIYHEEVISIPLAEPTGRHYEREWVHGWYYNPIFPGVYAYPIYKG